MIYKYPCGCEFEIEKTDNKITCIKFIPYINSINKDCSATWDLIGEGNTIGCFQIDGFLGRQYAKKTKPRNIMELADLIALIRPGALESIMDDGKNATDHYVMRKNNEEEVSYLHPALEPILKNTYGILIYQEQCMKIAQELAGMSSSDADTYIRYGIGKKKVEVIEKGKKIFIKGAIKNEILNKQEAEEIFSWIEKSQRYLFNASHSVVYAMNSYLSAYEKTHFPRAFFASRLQYMKDHSQAEAFITNANSMNITVSTPDIRLGNSNFIIKDKKIMYGLGRIKSVGSSSISTILDADIPETWYEFLITKASKINSSSVEALVKSGALDYTRESRNRMFYEYKIFRNLTGKQQDWLYSNYSTSLKVDIQTMLMLGSGRDKPSATIKSLKKLEDQLELLNNPPLTMLDTIDNLYAYEVAFLGAGITCTELDSCNISAATHNTQDFQKTRPKMAVIAGTITKISEIKTKNGPSAGQHMAFIDISDSFGSLDGIVIFPDPWHKYQSLVFEENNIIIKGYSNQQSFIAQELWQAK